MRRCWLAAVGFPRTTLLATLGVLSTGSDRNVRELDSTFDKRLVNLREVGQHVLLALELFAPLFDQERDPILNLKRRKERARTDSVMESVIRNNSNDRSSEQIASKRAKKI